MRTMKVHKKIYLSILLTVITLGAASLYASAKLKFISLGPNILISIIIATSLSAGFVLTAPFPEWRVSGRRILLVIGFIGAFMLVHIRISIPLLSTYIKGTPFERQYVVQKKIRKYLSTSGTVCLFRISLVEFQGQADNYLCVPESLWLAVSEGSRVIGVGEETALGVRFNSFKPMSNITHHSV